MKKYITRFLSGLVSLAIFIGCMAMTNALAQTNLPSTAKTFTDAKGEYTLEWFTPKRPPMPPVKKDGKWVPWEDVYGPLPSLPPKQVKRYKNPPPVDPSLRWMEAKQRLAPQLFVKGKLKPQAEEMFNKARKQALEKAKKPVLHPKVDALNPRLTTRSQNSQIALRGGPENGDGPLDNGNPRLELVNVDNYTFPGWTIIDLWLIDAPANEWWEIFYAPILKSTEWRPLYVGSPDFVFDNIQWFVLAIPGNPPEGYFTAFLNRDVDFDGISDGYEAMLFKTDPTNPDSNSSRDANGNGQPDHLNLGGNEIADGDEDFDGDGLSNLYELQLGINPFVAQNNAIDSDADGLPDWLEELITLYTGDPDPTPTGDSDGDGINNITEWQLQTDPSWAAEWIWASFANLPDHNRTVEHQSLELSSEWPSLLALNNEEDPEVPAEAYFDASFAGYHGTAAQLTVLKDTDADGNYALGIDTFKWAAAYQTPPSFVPAQNIPAPNPDDGLIEEDDLLRSVTSFIGGRWKAAKVNEKLAMISEPSLIHIQHRSYQRMWIRFRKLQLVMVAQEMPQGVLLRVKSVIAEIHTEATILRETTLQLGQRFPGTQFLARMGRFVPIAGSICSVLSAVEGAVEIVPVLNQYMIDVRRHCDNNNDTALDLAVMWSMLTDNAFPAPVQTAYLWPIWWDALSNFDGWDSSCW